MIEAIIPLVAVVTFATFSFLGGSLSASIIFPSMILFDISSPLAHITDGYRSFSQAIKPMRKIEDFLLAEESNHSSTAETSKKPSLSLYQAELQHTVSSESTDDTHIPFSLQIDELIIDSPSFYGIQGGVGSGKSIFLKALLHEVALIRGSVEVSGRIAYCAQEPWIMQSSIERNIVFGSEYDSDRLSLAIECCGLNQDLLLFPNGIKTEIGESGVNLSGGQKSRVALARAFYANADIYLLDHPLAACDSKVSWRIFSQLREVLKDKIVLMVSNSPSFLAKMDYSIQLEEGIMKSFSSISPVDYKDLENVQEEDLDTIAESVTENQLVDSFVVQEEKKNGHVKRRVIWEVIQTTGTVNLLIFGISAIFSLTLAITIKVKDWPLRGDIELNSVQVAYDQRPYHLVIKNLSLSIKSDEKIGICGRTGCGKSTLISSLFRLIELKGGVIKIDGVDISQIDLKTLRKGMHIIPQDPILFTGTIRSNLGSEIEDVELWEALEGVGLKDYVQSLEEKLDSPVDASGSNMSFGQRCLARAFLAKPVILVMDEATASIDQESDERVQSIIKQHFQQATILSIAHRLESIADFDKILVLDQGELVEFDTPSSLLSNPQSAFSQLVDAAGPESQAKIRFLSQ